MTSNFFSKGDLTAHFRLHTGEKVYNGGQCDKTFPFYSSFIVHPKTHSEEKSFNCSQCGMNVSKLSHFKTHMWVHGGNRPRPY